MGYAFAYPLFVYGQKKKEEPISQRTLLVINKEVY